MRLTKILIINLAAALLLFGYASASDKDRFAYPAHPNHILSQNKFLVAPVSVVNAKTIADKQQPQDDRQLLEGKLETVTAELQSLNSDNRKLKKMEAVLKNIETLQDENEKIISKTKIKSKDLDREMKDLIARQQQLFSDNIILRNISEISLQTLKLHEENTAILKEIDRIRNSPGPQESGNRDGNKQSNHSKSPNARETVKNGAGQEAKLKIKILSAGNDLGVAVETAAIIKRHGYRVSAIDRFAKKVKPRSKTIYYAMKKQKDADVLNERLGKQFNKKPLTWDKKFDLILFVN